MIIGRAQKHWLIVVLGSMFALAAGVQAMTWLINQGTYTWYQSVGWKSNEQNILDQLGPSEQIGYIKSVLGEPIFRDGDEKYQEYVFKRRFGYIQAVADKNEKVVLYSIVSCITDFKPSIHLPEGKKVRLNFDSLKSTNLGNTYYSISGATANSYLIEGGYGGNPSNYQETYVGATDSCGVISAPSGTYDLLEETKCKNSHLGLQGFTEDFCKYDKTDRRIDKMREEVLINTAIMTAPNVSIKDLRPLTKFGPDRVQLRALPNYYAEWH